MKSPRQQDGSASGTTETTPREGGNKLEVPDEGNESAEKKDRKDRRDRRSRRLKHGTLFLFVFVLIDRSIYASSRAICVCWRI
jgi:hypothetical protein